MKKYRLAPQAENDLLEIFLTGISKWGYPQAEKYADELHYCFNMLADHPEMGATREDLKETPQSFIKGAHTIIYRSIDNGLIEIATILLQKMDIENRFNSPLK